MFWSLIVDFCLCVFFCSVPNVTNHSVVLTLFGTPGQGLRTSRLDQFSGLNIKCSLSVSLSYSNLSTEGPYGIFAGRDATRGLATFCLEKDALRDEYDDLSDLNAVQMESVREWEMQFKGELLLSLFIWFRIVLNCNLL